MSPIEAVERVKYKNIKSVAHNLGHSFLSDMNATGGGQGYLIVPELLFAAAAAQRVPEVRIDFLRREVIPPSVASTELQRSVASYARMLYELCERQNVEPRAVRRATLTLVFDHDRVRGSKNHPVREIQEFDCTVEIEDDRGIVHRAQPNHWWMV